MAIVYDLDGQAHEKEPIDVRECVHLLGWSTTPPESEPVVEAVPESEPVVEKKARK
jgi:hypothetical protein